jgi:hypothetical protein
MAKGGKAEKSAARSARLSAALRENLKRRKEQARARTGTGAPPGPKSQPSAEQEIAKQTKADSPPAEAEAGASPEFRRNPVRE